MYTEDTTKQYERNESHVLSATKDSKVERVTDQDLRKYDRFPGGMTTGTSTNFLGRGMKDLITRKRG